MQVLQHADLRRGRRPPCTARRPPPRTGGPGPGRRWRRRGPPGSPRRARPPPSAHASSPGRRSTSSHGVKGGRPSVSQHAPVRTMAPVARGLVGDRVGEGGLADPRLSDEQQQPAAAALGVGEGRGADRKESLPTDEHDPTLLTTGRGRRVPVGGRPGAGATCCDPCPGRCPDPLALAWPSSASSSSSSPWSGLPASERATSETAWPCSGRSASCPARPPTRRRRGCPSARPSSALSSSVSVARRAPLRSRRPRPRRHRPRRLVVAAAVRHGDGKPVCSSALVEALVGGGVAGSPWPPRLPRRRRSAVRRGRDDLDGHGGDHGGPLQTFAAWRLAHDQ